MSGCGRSSVVGSDLICVSMSVSVVRYGQSDNRLCFGGEFMIIGVRREEAVCGESNGDDNICVNGRRGN